MKGIAIQTILLLLVGILVVGIIVFMVYRYFVGAPLSQQECRSRIISWCSACKVMNFSTTGYAMGPELGGMNGCIERYGFGSGSTWTAGTDCTSQPYTTVEPFCRAFTP